MKFHPVLDEKVVCATVSPQIHTVEQMLWYLIATKFSNFNFHKWNLSCCEDYCSWKCIYSWHGTLNTTNTLHQHSDWSLKTLNWLTEKDVSNGNVSSFWLQPAIEAVVTSLHTWGGRVRFITATFICQGNFTFKTVSATKLHKIIPLSLSTLLKRPIFLQKVDIQIKSKQII